MPKVIYGNMMAGKRTRDVDEDEPNIEELASERYGTTVPSPCNPIASVSALDEPTAFVAGQSATRSYTGDEEGLARTCSGPVFHGTSDGTYTCYGCDNRLSWVRPFERKVCGVVQHVIGHFRHTASTNCTKGGETIYHNAAKHAAATANLKYEVPCCETNCDQSIPVIFEEDVVYEVECPFRNYKLDVGVKDRDGNVVGAIEIFETHAIDKEKRSCLTDHNLAWVEVRSRRVLGAVESGQQSCTANLCAFSRCQACEEKRRIQELNREEQRANAVAETERRARAVLKIREEQRANAVAETERRAMAVLKIPQNIYTSLLNEEWHSFWKQCLDAAAEKLGDDAPDWTTEIVCEVAERAEIDASNVEAGSVVLAFGKYKGRPLASIMQTEESYVRWCAGWTGQKDGNRPEVTENAYAAGVVREEARRLLKGRCLLCFGNTGQDWKNWCSNCYRDA